eukprot:m51a1_g13090 hypothetical protein (187) ;mRNA; f:95-1091
MDGDTQFWQWYGEQADDGGKPVIFWASHWANLHKCELPKSVLATASASGAPAQGKVNVQKLPPEASVVTDSPAQQEADDEKVHHMQRQGDLSLVSLRLEDADKLAVAVPPAQVTPLIATMTVRNVLNRLLAWAKSRGGAVVLKASPDFKAAMGAWYHAGFRRPAATAAFCWMTRHVSVFAITLTTV